MQISPAGIAFIRQRETCSLVAFQDEGGVWTIAYGRTAGVHAGLAITEKVAKQMFANDLKSFSASTNSLIGPAPTTQSQFDALVSLEYNIGKNALRTSTVLRRHIAGDYPAAGNAFLLFNMEHIDGALVEVDGLMSRRRMERAMYLS